MQYPHPAEIFHAIQKSHHYFESGIFTMNSADQYIAGLGAAVPDPRLRRGCVRAALPNSVEDGDGVRLEGCRHTGDAAWLDEPGRRAAATGQAPPW
ncbi:hypothetical protein ACI2S5_21995 [Ralstonia nicotianae]|nr:hypothetical protein [Ralstonia pseudosolanacearum]MCK4143594.1 hypothetical protein [Ralstonia pseudosolanacearum]UZF22562.1 hypothetical protein LG939_18330 [Ralstonia solanacearum]